MIYRAAPVSLNETEAAKFRTSAMRYQYGINFEMPEVFLASVPNARICGPDFLVLSQDNHIFFESALMQPQVLERTGILDTIIWPAPRLSQPNGCLMAQECPNAYYHWLIEVLPKLSLLEPFQSLRSIPLIVSHSLKGFQRESLEMVGVTNRLLPFDGTCWEFDKLLFPALLGPTGCPSPHAVAWLRRNFLKHAKLAVNSPRRIYITRSDAAQRRVLNEDEVVNFLQSEGFEVVCPGKLSLLEQIDLFANVDVVVAAHGAAGPNMVFAPADAMLIELFGDNYINGCFWAVTNIRGQRYGFVTGPATWLDYSIAVEDLKTLLGMMLKSRGANPQFASL